MKIANQAGPRNENINDHCKMVDELVGWVA